MSIEREIAVIRECVVEVGSTDSFKIGDRVRLHYGYTATCQKINKNGEALFLFDQVLPGYTDYSYIGDCFAGMASKVIPVNVISFMRPFGNTGYDKDFFRIPYAEEIFGELDWVVPSGKKQWELMKNTKNRIAVTLDGYAKWYWLKNRHKDNASAFASAASRGYAYVYSASRTLSVRPVFKLQI